MRSPRKSTKRKKPHRVRERLARRRGGRRLKRCRPGRTRRNLQFEALEERHLLATFTVNSLLDKVDLNPGNGVVETGVAGEVTLRAAIMESNARLGDDMINLPAGFFTLTLSGANENNSHTGDLDVLGNLTISGAGVDDTVINGGQLDRVLHVIAGTLDLSDVTITGGRVYNATIDTSLSYGGGIRNDAILNISDCKINGNTLYAWAAGYGGGVSSGTGTTLTIENTTISNNSLEVQFGSERGYGGGVYSAGSVIAIADSSLTGNSLTSGVSLGGGLYLEGVPDGTISNSMVDNNSAAWSTGGIFNSGTVDVYGTTVSGNTAPNGSAGILDSGAMTLTNSTVSGNTVAGPHSGGGINNSGTLTVAHSTITNNHAGTVFPASGGGMVNSGTANVAHTIIAENTASTGPDASGSFISGGYNLIGDGSNSTGFTDGVNGDKVGTSAVPIGPELGTLQENGGPTHTHALLAGSPAMEAGDPSFNPNAYTPPLTTDQRGLPRVSDGDTSGTAVIDIGAYEVESTAVNVDVSISKNDGLTATVPGNSLTYTITLTGDAATDVTGVTVADTFPATLTDLNVTNVQLSDGTAGSGPGTPSTTISTGPFSNPLGGTADLPAGSSIVYTVTAVIDPSARGTLVNSATATVGGTFVDTNTANNTGTDNNTLLTPQVDLQVSKSESADPVVPGSGAGNLVYTVTVTNAGPSDATGVTIGEDLTLPSGVTRDSVVPSAGNFVDTAGPDGTWTLNLASGASATLTVTLTAGVATQTGTDVISNTANVTDIAAGETLINTGDDSATESTSVQISSVNTDWGDAPDPLIATAGEYPTLAANNGASHVIESGFHLGNFVDADPDGQPHPQALGDDLDGNIDDEGVSFLNAPYFPGNSGYFDVTVTDGDGIDGNQYLDAWFDLNNDGDWLDANEQIADKLVVSTGVNQVNYTIPVGTAAGYHFLRFRLSRVGDLPPDGPTASGEVEDYAYWVNDFGENFDWGDAPSPYPTFSGPIGAVHGIVAGFHLGANIDADLNGQPNATATGDDINMFYGGPIPPGVDDEDGVTPPPSILTGQPASLSVFVTGTGGKLDAWFDYNQDNDWDDPGEQVVTSQPMSPGANPVNITIPYSAMTGTTNARFRLSTSGGLDPRGYAVDGEVEDYQFTIERGLEPDLDWGDAPDATGGTSTGNPYPTLFEHDGARHTIVIGGPTLGPTIDPEPDGQPDATATGDDSAGAIPDDEDGVYFVSGTYLASGLSATTGLVVVDLQNADPTSNLLDAWIDFNQDGDWSDPGEQIFASQSLGTSNGTKNLNFTIPQDTGANVVTGTTFARFRLSTTGGLQPTGLASDGEVEDHTVMICSTHVSNTLNTGDGSLRQAITCANTVAGYDTISFDIPGPGPHTIALANPLPPITEPVIIDGTSEPNFLPSTPNPVVEINGSGAGVGKNGLTVSVTAAGSVIRGLAINRFSGHGIVLSGGGYNMISGNYVGTDTTGTVAQGNGKTGIFVTNSSGNQIGGTATGDGNVISGNTQQGIRFSSGSTNNVVLGKLIGIDAGGTTALGNLHGLSIVNAPGNWIGGTVDAARNVISGNDRYGVQITGTPSSSNRIEGNLIGTDVTGTVAVGNGYQGVVIATNSSANTIGGTVDGAGNVISGNDRNGIYIRGTSGNQIQGNLIGTDRWGNAAVGNTLQGVALVGAGTGHVIGGTTDSAGNVISANDKHGVQISGGTTGVVVQHNLIGTNLAGTAGLGNTLNGVTIINSPSNNIGGTALGAGNVISDNRRGVMIRIAGSTGNLIQGNLIGTGLSGGALGNRQEGVRIIEGASSNTIGGTTAGAGNVIANNNADAVALLGGTGNAIQQNSMFNNGQLGIDLNDNGPTPNDTNDPDMGANRLQNYPEIASVVIDGTNLDIHYSVPSVTPNSAFPLTVEFFLADSSGAEGQTYLGSHSYVAPGTPIATIPKGSAVGGSVIVATATDVNGNTSEFSTSVEVAGSPLSALEGEAAIVSSEVLKAAEVDPLLDHAIAAWVAAGISDSQVARLKGLQVGIVDLSGARLGEQFGNTITIDVNAAGYGWHTDLRSPISDFRFESTRTIDLLTVLYHELGHALGLEDDYSDPTSDDLMNGWLATGTRRMPSTDDLDGLFTDQEALDELFL